jgi:hypothetical protein
VGKATLLEGLQAWQCAGKQPGLFSLHLHTKYYEADLLVQCHEAPNSSAAALGEFALDQVQALVLVVDASRQSSWDYVTRFYESLEEREFDIQLLVANKMDSLLTHPGQTDPSSITRPAWLDSTKEWCYSHGFEYIEAAAGKPALDAALQEDGEQQGVARVLAALEAHMWPSMQQKPRVQQVSTSAVAMDSSSTAATSSSSSCAVARDQGHAAVAGAALAGSAASTQDGREPSHQQQAGQPATALDAVPTSSQPHVSTAGQQAAAAPAERQGPAAPAADAAAAGKKGQAAGQQRQQLRSEQAGAVAGVSAVGAAAAGWREDLFLDADVDDFEQLMRQVMGETAGRSACALHDTVC